MIIFTNTCASLGNLKLSKVNLFPLRVLRIFPMGPLLELLTNHKIKLLDMFKNKVALYDIAKIEKSQIFVLFENEASYEDFFAHKYFKVMLRILCVTFSVKILSKEVQGYKSNILLLVYQYSFIDVFFIKSIIEI